MQFRPLLLWAAALLVGLSFAGSSEASVLISADAQDLQYTGRIDFSEPKAPLLSWAGTEVSANFTGAELSVILDDQRGENSFNVFIDGNLEAPLVLHCQKGEQHYTVSTTLSAGPHRFLLTKRTEGAEGSTLFKGIELADGATLLPPPARPLHRIEIFGDSISSGMGNEAADGTGDGNPREKNNFLAYGPIAARDLNAEIHVISQSGIGVMISWFDFIMPQFYDQVNAVGNNDTKWDFSQWTPEVVVINLFQNDSWLIDDHHRLQPEPNDQERIEAYANFVRTIRKCYPKANIICSLGSMDATREGSKWPGYVSAAVKLLKKEGDAEKIDTLFFDFTGYGAHPRVRHHQANAKKLSDFIREKMGW